MKREGGGAKTTLSQVPRKGFGRAGGGFFGLLSQSPFLHFIMYSFSREINEFNSEAVIQHVGSALFSEIESSRPGDSSSESLQKSQVSIEFNGSEENISLHGEEGGDLDGGPSFVDLQDIVPDFLPPSPSVVGLPFDIAVERLLIHQGSCALAFLHRPQTALDELLGPDLPLFLGSQISLRQRLLLFFYRRQCGWSWDQIEKEYASLKLDLPASHNLPSFAKVRTAFSSFDVLTPIRLLVCEKGSPLSPLSSLFSLLFSFLFYFCFLLFSLLYSPFSLPSFLLCSRLSLSSPFSFPLFSFSLFLVFSFSYFLLFSLLPPSFDLTRNPSRELLLSLLSFTLYSFS